MLNRNFCFVLKSCKFAKRTETGIGTSSAHHIFISGFSKQKKIKKNKKKMKICLLFTTSLTLTTLSTTL